MSRYQELNWYLGSQHTPELNVPVLIRLASATKNHEAAVPYRAVRVAAKGVRGNTLYIVCNDKNIPTAADANADNSFTVSDIHDWSFL